MGYAESEARGNTAVVLSRIFFYLWLPLRPDGHKQQDLKMVQRLDSSLLQHLLNNSTCDHSTLLFKVGTNPRGAGCKDDHLLLGLPQVSQTHW
jgi:hypothetical protein